MTGVSLAAHQHATDRHTSSWIETGPTAGPLIIFVHGWPELGIVWREQLEYFGRRGWRSVAPDMRGYGGSSVPDRVAAYAVREIVARYGRASRCAGRRASRMGRA
jgi:pimeloyl-ACP methyl ester carboxylesterase